MKHNHTNHTTDP